MGDLFTGSWIPKVISLLILASTGLAAMGEPWTYFGIMFANLAAALGFLVVRQNNVSSEAAGAKPPPQIIKYMDAPPSRK